MNTLQHQQYPSFKEDALIAALKDTRRRDSQQHLMQIAHGLMEIGYDFSDVELLGEGSESSAYKVKNRNGIDRVIKITSPLSHGWEQDWGRRIFDAQMVKVLDGTVHDLGNGCYWFVQEYAKPITRAEEVEESLWLTFERQIEQFGGNLFLDDSGLLKQLGIVERKGTERLVLVDYSALSAHDNGFCNSSY